MATDSEQIQCCWWKVAGYHVVCSAVSGWHPMRFAPGAADAVRGTYASAIRSWLGHVSLDTTNHYARANLETKRKALEQVAVPTTSGGQPSWKRDASVLAWLDTL